MGRLVMAVITIAIIGFIAYKQVYGRSALSAGKSEPKQRLENVQNAANRIEAEQQKAANKALEQGEQAEAQ